LKKYHKSLKTKEKQKELFEKKPLISPLSTTHITLK